MFFDCFKTIQYIHQPFSERSISAFDVCSGLEKKKVITQELFPSELCPFRLVCWLVPCCSECCTSNFWTELCLLSYYACWRFTEEQLLRKLSIDHCSLSELWALWIGKLQCATAWPCHIQSDNDLSPFYWGFSKTSLNRHRMRLSMTLVACGFLQFIKGFRVKWIMNRKTPVPFSSGETTDRESGTVGRFFPSQEGMRSTLFINDHRTLWNRFEMLFSLSWGFFESQILTNLKMAHVAMHFSKSKILTRMHFTTR